MYKFLKYWDEVFDYWMETGKVQSDESHWFMQKTELLPELMPEPYMGDPYNCSVTIMNYNPGAFNHKTNTEEGQKLYRTDPAHHTFQPHRQIYQIEVMASAREFICRQSGRERSVFAGRPRDMMRSRPSEHRAKAWAAGL